MNGKTCGQSLNENGRKGRIARVASRDRRRIAISYDALDGVTGPGNRIAKVYARYQPNANIEKASFGHTMVPNMRPFNSS
jgi:hypothetical protein